MWKLQLFKLNYDYREVSAVKNVVESGWLTLGEKLKNLSHHLALLFLWSKY